MLVRNINYNYLKNVIKHGSFYKDTANWFNRKQDGHMGKWQYFLPKHAEDPARGALLWEEWANNPKFYMLEKQRKLIQKHAEDIGKIFPNVEKIVDLGPGDGKAFITNTIPFLDIYKSALKKYVAIDICSSFCKEATTICKEHVTGIDATGVCKDFTHKISDTNNDDIMMGLCFGGIVGNYESVQNNKNSISLLIKELLLIKQNFPVGSAIIFGLDANQNTASLYESYDDPVHAAYEINVLHRIKRDIMPEQKGFTPDGWQYKMRWYPNSYQFCHIAQVIKRQVFWLDGKEFVFEEGEELVVDNSFKFPVGIFQQAAIRAGYEPLASYLDDDKRMALHVLRVVA